MYAKLVATLAAFTSLASGLAAQEPPRVVGVGITVPDVGLLLPINVSEHVRIEPYMLFYSLRTDLPVSSDTTWSSQTRLGVGVFSVTRATEAVRIYFGPRFGLLWGSESINGPTFGQKTLDNSGWFVGGAIGGEYSPVARISVGGEAKVEYLHTSTSSSGAGTASGTPNLPAYEWYSTGALVVRFYP